VVLGKETEAFGSQGSPMSIAFRVDEYLPAGSERQVYEPLHLPKNQLEEAIPATLIEMTVGDSTREIWLQRGEAPEGPSYKTLDKFEVAFEPGTEKPTKFVSQVRLTDNSQGIKDQPHTISMNEPLSHRGFRFYQMRYSAMQDPRTGQRTGQFQSVLQVATDPGRSIKYLGCIVLVLGIYLQFYMKAGVFSGVGKKAGERTPPKEGSPEGRSDLASNNLPASPPIDELL
jgi:hypothetical protein